MTLELIVQGEGNLRGLAAPIIDFPGDFEVFPPEVTETIDRSGSRIRGSKTYTYVLIPRSPGEKNIPPVEMSYFDAESGLYATSASEPLRLDVTGDPVIGVAIGRAGVETLREDIRFIQIGPPSIGVLGESLADAPGFWIVALFASCGPARSPGPTQALGPAGGRCRVRAGTASRAGRQKASRPGPPGDGR